MESSIPGILPGMTRAEKQKIYRRRYAVTAIGRANQSAASRKYYQTEKGRSHVKRSRDTRKAEHPLKEYAAQQMAKAVRQHIKTGKKKSIGKHFKSTFEHWMTWENYGMYRTEGPRTWCIGHRIPASAYDSKSKEDMRRCFALPNLYAQCSKENAASYTAMPSDEVKNALKDYWPLAWC